MSEGDVTMSWVMSLPPFSSSTLWSTANTPMYDSRCALTVIDSLLPGCTSLLLNDSDTCINQSINQSIHPSTHIIRCKAHPQQKLKQSSATKITLCKFMWKNKTKQNKAQATYIRKIKYRKDSLFVSAQVKRCNNWCHTWQWRSTLNRCMQIGLWAPKFLAKNFWKFIVIFPEITNRCRPY